MNGARIARRWPEAGGDYGQMAEALNDELTEELATKSDLRALEGALKSEIAGLRTEFRAEVGTEIGGLRTALAKTRGELEGKIENAKAEIIKWVAG